MSKLDFFVSVITSSYKEIAMNNILKIFYAFLTVAVTSVICSYFTQFGINTFYDSLIKPPFLPANQLFPVAWSFLYALMIISYYLVLKDHSYAEFRPATLMFLGQLFLQMLWTYLFFFGAYFLFAGIVILLLLWTVAEMIKSFKQLNQFAAYLQYPYFLWLIFAAYLNFGIIYLNGNTLNL
jgi:translocator protein